MRQVAHFCVTLRHSCGSKTLESPLFDSFLAQNRWLNRRDGEKPCRRKGLGGVYTCYKSDALWRILSTPRPVGNGQVLMVLGILAVGEGFERVVSRPTAAS
jgi:hypothetical protein